MTVESRFAPIYRAAASRGLDVDSWPPHKVRWAFSEPIDPDAPETIDEYQETVRARMAELAGGPPVEHEPFDPLALGLR